MYDELSEPGVSERLAQWRQQVDAERRPLPRAVADGIRQRLLQLASVDPIFASYVGGFRDALGDHASPITINFDDWTYTLTSPPSTGGQ